MWRRTHTIDAPYPTPTASSCSSEKLFCYRWDAPTKNPNAVDGYRIYYHEAAVVPPQTSSSTESASIVDTMNNATSSMSESSATLEIQRIDVKDTTISINGLKKDVLYELVVKAGNVYGK